MVGISRGGGAGGGVEGPASHGSWCRIDAPKGLALVVEKEATVGARLDGGADPEIMTSLPATTLSAMQKTFPVHELYQ